MSGRSGLARRSVGAGGLWLFAVSASAPLTVLVGGVQATYAGTGVVAVPLSFVVLVVALAVLSAGYVAMARYVPHAATFYALLGHGLGRACGVAGAVVALVGYNAIQISLYGLLGSILAAAVGGPWWVWAAVVWAAIGLLGGLRVGIGAGLVAVLLVAEIAVIVLFDLGALANPAPGGLSWVPWEPDRLAVDGVGGVFALGIAAFVGFECGPAFGEEARSPRAVGRATFAALLFLGPFYAVAAWALAVATGPELVADAARQDPQLPLTVLDRSFGVFGPLVADLGAVLLVTSVFAAMLSFHLTVARYVFALARERVLPAAWARTGSDSRSRRDAPVAGSLAQSGLAAVVVAAFAAAGADPVADLFTWFSTGAAVAVLAVLVAASAAALRWFRRGGGTSEGPLVRVVLPILGMVTGGGVLAVMVANLRTLLGGGPRWLHIVIPVVVAAAALLGLAWAGVLRRSRPDVYAGIGRGRPHPLAVPDRRLDEVRL